ncbi:MAG: phytanoyl-CoA dioxygenase family protein [Acidobacteriia bacterium]|nr:phytanoyl-CoA dioxygenase family protein [Terriglobia bacterium]
MAFSKSCDSSLCQQPPAQDFAREGFVVLTEFLDIHEVERIRTSVESALTLPRHPACTRPHNTLLPLRWNDDIVDLVLRFDDRVQILSDALRADDLKWISGYVSIKEAHSPALWWHQDWWCWDHPVSYRRAAPQVALLCYLTDTSVYNGALRILPGSHLKSAPIHAALPEAHGHTAEDLEPDHIAMDNLSDQVTLCLKAGDAVAIDYRLLHGTHGNPSEKRRDCIILNFAPSWKRLPDDIKAHLINHPAQPSDEEIAPASATTAKLLPSFKGARLSLPLNRNAPSSFEIVS